MPEDIDLLLVEVQCREGALLSRCVYTYEEFVIVTEAPQCNRMTATQIIKEQYTNGKVALEM